MQVVSPIVSLRWPAIDFSSFLSFHLFISVFHELYMDILKFMKVSNGSLSAGRTNNNTEVPPNVNLPQSSPTAKGGY